MVLFGVNLVSCITLLTWFSPNNFMFSDFLIQGTHFYCIIQIIFLMFYGVVFLKSSQEEKQFRIGFWISLTLCLYAFALNFLLLYPTFFPITHRQLSQHTFRWLHFDSEGCNGNSTHYFNRMIQRFKPDIVDIENARSCLPYMGKHYPYTLTFHSDSLLLSRFPLRLIGRENNSMLTFIDTPYGPLQSVILQPNNFRSLIKNYRSSLSLNLPLIVVGDFQTVPWAPYLKAISTALRLHNVANGYGLQPTWYPQLASFNQQWIGLPWDHVLTNAYFQTISYQVGENLGTVHRPIWVDLKFVLPERKAPLRTRF